MRKLLFFALLFFALSASAQEVERYWDNFDVGWLIETDDSTLVVSERVIQDDKLKITYYVNSSPYESDCGLAIDNKIDKEITVNWMKSHLGGSRITFHDVSKIKINDPIPNDIIFGGERLYKRITSVLMASNPQIRTFYLDEAKKKFKKTGEPQYKKTNVVLCIEIDGIEKLYKFTLNGVYNGKRK